MSTAVIRNTIIDGDGFVTTEDEDFFFTASSFVQATDINDEGITIANGEDVSSVVTVAGNVIGNRVGVELDGSDRLLITQTGVARDERAFGVRSLGRDNVITVAGVVGGTDVGAELDGDRDRLTITATGTVSGVEDPAINFRPAGVNLRGEDNVLENHGTITAGTLANAATI